MKAFEKIQFTRIMDDINDKVGCPNVDAIIIAMKVKYLETGRR